MSGTKNGSMPAGDRDLMRQIVALADEEGYRRGLQQAESALMLLLDEEAEFVDLLHRLTMALSNADLIVRAVLPPVRDVLLKDTCEKIMAIALRLTLSRDAGRLVYPAITRQVEDRLQAVRAYLESGDVDPLRAVAERYGGDHGLFELVQAVRPHRPLDLGRAYVGQWLADQQRRRPGQSWIALGHELLHTLQDIQDRSAEQTSAYEWLVKQSALENRRYRESLKRAISSLKGGGKKALLRQWAK